MSGTRTSLAAALAVALACSPAGAARADGDDEHAPRVEGRVGLGGLVTYAYPGAAPTGALDARTMLDLRLDADDLGRQPVGLRVDADLFLDIDDLELRTYRVLDLNLRFRPRRDRVTVTLGRQRVADGTEELVDGAGVRVAAGKGFFVGGYGGLLPDPFTTLASVRTAGGGAVAGFTAARFRAELATGFGVRDGQLDHGFVNLSTAGSPVRALTLFARLKAQSLPDAPGIGLADVFAGASLRPVSALRLRVHYNAYSSERYVSLLERDPTLTRFAARADALELIDELPNDRLDATLYHGVGADVDVRDGARHLAVGGRYRYRFAPDPDDHYLLAEGHGGLIALGRGGAEVRAAGRFIHAAGRDVGQGELGVELPAWQQRLQLGVYALYSGSRALPGESRGIHGVYGDLFVDLWLGKGWSVAAAAQVGWEDTPAAAEMTVDGLLKVSHRFRRVAGAKAAAGDDGAPAAAPGTEGS